MAQEIPNFIIPISSSNIKGAVETAWEETKPVIEHLPKPPNKTNAQFISNNINACNKLIKDINKEYPHPVNFIPIFTIFKSLINY
jgi:hypothetical protein